MFVPIYFMNNYFAYGVIPCNTDVQKSFVQKCLLLFEVVMFCRLLVPCVSLFFQKWNQEKF